MASRASPLTQPLTKAAVINQLDSWQAGRALPVACLQGPPLEDEDGWRAVVHFVRYRNGGFMIATPATQTVGDFLGTFIDEDGEPQALTRQVSIRLETNRSKFVTVGDVLLVDLPWFYLDSILKPQILKNTPSDHIQRISRDGVVLRPNAEAAIEASEVWVLEHGGEEIFQEYATAQEDAEEVEVPADQGQGEGEQLLRLQTRIAELEAQASAVAPVPARPARDLFPPEGDQHLSPQLMDQLKGLAGPPPNRLGRVETAFMTPTAKPKARTSFLEAEKEAEAIPPDEMDALAESLTDPMQRLLAMQMKQTNMLMNRLAPKQHDVLASALSGGGSEPGSSSGVRGCAARELFLRQLEDSSAIARVVLANAQRELGLPTSSIYGGLMRDYIEKKVPLGDMKLLTFVAMLFANQWEAAFEARDELMMGHVSRGLMFVEQCAMDAGKTQFAWLLTGLPEPNWSITTVNRRRQSLQPFSRLAQPAWVATNVAFLRDLDFIETKLRSAGGKTNTTTEDSLEEKPDKPPKRPWPKKKAKGARNETGESQGS